jgi:bacterial/archaeal transporter family protein
MASTLLDRHRAGNWRYCQLLAPARASTLHEAMAWLIPTLLYVVGVGALGVTGKLALRTLDWPDLILWTGAGYIVVASFLLAIGQTHLRFTHDTAWAMGSGALAIGSLIMLYLALGVGDAGKVVSISAAYPAVTLVLAAAFLAESLTVGRAAGAAIIVAGVVVVTLAK